MEALSKLGPLLALSTQSIQEVIKPQKVYCLLFGICLDGIISGPDLFSWITKSK
jgi:hypothetical protein